MHQVDSKIYQPTKKDWAFWPQPAYPQAECWWYYDAVFDNGYCINTAWRVNDLKAQILTEISDPDGKLVGKRVHFPRNAIKASTETLDITMGKNRIYGEFPKYYTSFHVDDMGEDLVYEATTQEFREPPDGCYIGRCQSPVTPVYFTYVMRPRCKVSGTITVKGKKISVTGQGYCDHQLGNVPWAHGILDWYIYSKAHLPNHTITFWDANLCANLGYQRMKWLAVFKGDKLLGYSNYGNAYTETSDFEEIDLATGTPFPKKIVVILDESLVKGTLTFKMKHDLILFPRGWVFPFRRHLVECHAEVEIDGEKVVSDSMEVQEIASRFWEGKALHL